MSDIEWRKKVDVLLAKQDQAITAFQWITNNIPMNAEQRIRLGAAIVSVYDEGEALRKWMAGE